jgi:alpha-glucosidase
METLQTLKEVKAPPTWVLCNHDTPRVVARLGGSHLGKKKARALALLTHALPGGVYIYQGEELGLDDAKIADADRQDPIFIRSHGKELGRDACRVPLPWKKNELNYGFSTNNPWIPIPGDWQSEAVDYQAQDSSSHLNFYRKFLDLRKKHPALGGNSEVKFLETPTGVLGFSREPGFAAIANTSNETQKVDIAGEIIIASSDGVDVEDSYLKIPAHTTVWLNI